MESVTPSSVTKNKIYRSSCNGVEIRIVQTPGLTYLVVRGRGHDHYAELPDADVGATVAEFQAIGEDPDRFQAFVNARVAAV
jgi:hypothetical protein